MSHQGTTILPKRLFGTVGAFILTSLACTLSTPSPTPTQFTPSQNTQQPIESQTTPESVTSTPEPQIESSATWNAALSIEPTAPTRVGYNSYFSSTALAVSWSSPAQAVDHFEITTTDEVTTVSVVETVSAQTTNATLTDLKAGTTYTIDIRACSDASCSQALESSAPATTTTAEEYWQIQGTGNSYETALQIVDDGTNAPYLFQYGPEAGADLNGDFQVYYNSHPTSTWGPGIQIGFNDTTNPSVDTLSTFTQLSSGIRRCDPKQNSGGCLQGALRLATFQAVPLAGEGVVRLYFEAAVLEQAQPQETQPSGAVLPNIGNPLTRIYYLDSQDGYVGQDFNPSPAADVCEERDLVPGGACDPTLVVGVQGDAEFGDSGLTYARQFKIGYPVLDSWAWDSAPGTFMIITGADSCGATIDGQFYATWNGTQWQVEKDPSGCAKALALNGHGPVVVHLGATRYKLYYEARTAAQIDKPLHVFYADGTLSGDNTRVEFEDWESAEAAREVHFLWPNGDPVSAADESGLGDHFIFFPTGEPSTQIMYMNLRGLDNSSNPGASPGIGMAVLVNP